MTYSGDREPIAGVSTAVLLDRQVAHRVAKPREFQGGNKDADRSQGGTSSNDPREFQDRDRDRDRDRERNRERDNQHSPDGTERMENKPCFAPNPGFRPSA